MTVSIFQPLGWWEAVNDIMDYAAQFSAATNGRETT